MLDLSDTRVVRAPVETGVKPDGTPQVRFVPIGCRVRLKACTVFWCFRSGTYSVTYDAACQRDWSGKPALDAEGRPLLGKPRKFSGLSAAAMKRDYPQVMPYVALGIEYALFTDGE